MKRFKLLFLTTTLIFSSLLFAADSGGGSKEGAGGEAETQLLDGKGKSLKEEDTCPICLEKPKKPAKISPCEHIFCLECLKEVAKTFKQCPFCRCELLNIIPIPVQQGGEAASTLPIVHITPELYLAQQKEAMRALYDLLPDGAIKDGAIARLNERPTNPSKWVGVEDASPEGFILKLNLSFKQLTGAIPVELELLTELRFLSLERNKLTGEIPTELGQLTELQYLCLSYNQLTGQIPQELGNLTKLIYLDLSCSQLTGEIPTELGQLTELQYLKLSFNQLTEPTPPELIRRGLRVSR